MRRGIRSVLRTTYRWHNQHVLSSSIEVDALVSQRHMGLLSTGCGCPSPNLLHNAWQDSRAFCSQAAATTDEQTTTQATPESAADAAKLTELKKELDTAAVESRAHHLFQQRAYRETADMLIDFFTKVEQQAKQTQVPMSEIRARLKISKQLYDLLMDALYRRQQVHLKRDNQRSVKATASQLHQAARWLEGAGYQLATRQYNMLLECSTSNLSLAQKHYTAMFQTGRSAPPNATTHLLLSRAYLEAGGSGNTDKALEHLRAAAAVAPSMQPRVLQALQGSQIRALRRCIFAHRREDAASLLAALLEGARQHPGVLSIKSLPADVFMDTMCLAAEGGQWELFSVCLSLLEGASQQVQLPNGDVQEVPASLEEGKLLFCINAAAKAGDVVAAQRLFDLLTTSLSQPNFQPWVRRQQQQQQQQQGGSSAQGADTTQQPEGSSQQQSQQQQQRQPQAAVYHAMMAAHLSAPSPDLSAVFEFVHKLQQAYPHLPRLASPFAGLAFVSEALNSEDLIATAYAVLSERKKAGGEVSTAMWNAVLRALALLGNLPATSKMFESYEGLGASHDVDSYNAVIEACVQQGKMPAAQKLVEYMASQYVESNQQTHSLICRGYLQAGDAEGLLRAAVQAKRAKVAVAKRILEKGAELARAQGKVQVADGLKGEMHSQQVRAGEREGYRPQWARGGRGDRAEGSGSSRQAAAGKA